MEANSIPIHQIVAIEENGGIGLGEDLPWSLRRDWEHFLHMTTKVKVYVFKCKILEIHSPLNHKVEVQICINDAICFT